LSAFLISKQPSPFYPLYCRSSTFVFTAPQPRWNIYRKFTFVSHIVAATGIIPENFVKYGGLSRGSPIIC
jgi:hypothetical protein